MKRVWASPPAMIWTMTTGRGFKWTSLKTRKWVVERAAGNRGARGPSKGTAITRGWNGSAALQRPKTEDYAPKSTSQELLLGRQDGTWPMRSRWGGITRHGDAYQKKNIIKILALINMEMLRENCLQYIYVLKRQTVVDFLVADVVSRGCLIDIKGRSSTSWAL